MICEAEADHVYALSQMDFSKQFRKALTRFQLDIPTSEHLIFSPSFVLLTIE